MHARHDADDASLPPRPRCRRPNVDAILLLALAIPVAALVAVLIWRSTLMVPINPNEGFNAYWATAAARHEPLYPAGAVFRSNNYPPLSFYLIGTVTYAIHDAVFAGRLVAWLAFFSIACTVAVTLRAADNDRTACCFAAMLFIAFMASQFTIYIGMDDPQMLAHAVISCGLLMVLRNRGDLWLSAAAVTVAAGLFIKHNIIALPTAITLWLMLVDRRRGLKFLLVLAVCGLAGLILCRLYYGPQFIIDLLMPRVYSLKRAYEKAIGWITPMQVPVAVAMLLLLIVRRDSYARLIMIYLALAGLEAFVSAAGDGVNFNAAFDLVIAFSLASGHVIGQLQRLGQAQSRSLRLTLQAIVAASVLLMSVVRASADAVRFFPWVRTERIQETAVRSLVDRLAAAPGLAYCEVTVICYWAGKPATSFSFEVSEAFELNKQSDTENAFVDQMQHRYFSELQLADPTFMPARILTAIRSRYAEAFQAASVGRIYLANPASP